LANNHPEGFEENKKWKCEVYPFEINRGIEKMRIIDPIPPVILFLGLGAFVIVTDTGIARLEYTVLIAVLLAAAFGSVLWAQRKSSDKKQRSIRRD